MTDWGALYREHVAGLAALAATLTDEQLAEYVPATPSWTVHHVFAHLAGVASDAVTGRMDGAPGPEWTSRHVSERAPLPLAELVAELATHQDGVAQSLAPAVGAPRAIVYDIAVHHADLHEGLGLPRLPDHLWLPVLEALPTRAGPLRGAVPPYEVFRGLFSRRSRAQMLAWGTALDADELDDLSVFGPRLDDQPVPAP